MASSPFLQSELVERRGVEMTDSDVAERGRRATVYYECDEGAEEYVAKYFAKARKWLSHQLGEHMGLKCAARRPCCHCCCLWAALDIRMLKID